MCRYFNKPITFSQNVIVDIFSFLKTLNDIKFLIIIIIAVLFLDTIFIPPLIFFAKLLHIFSLKHADMIILMSRRFLTIFYF